VKVMINDQSILPITGDNISLAWANAFIKCYEAPGGVLHSAVVRINADGEKGSHETPELRQIVETQLRSLLKKSASKSVVETVAGTIFPESIWKLAKGDRQKLYKEYEKMLPFARRLHANRNGMYFERLIAYPFNGGKTVNQLEHIISTFHRGNHRHSALQAGIFDPRKDHSNSRRLGFPCLQQVVFYPNGANGKGGLSVVALYANQTLVEKAYGNYLGLYRLGSFMAREMGIKMKEVVCIAAALKLCDSSTITKTACRPVVNAIRAVLNNA
jgi:thymidylate synthase